MEIPFIRYILHYCDKTTIDTLFSRYHRRTKLKKKMDENVKGLDFNLRKTLRCGPKSREYYYRRYCDPTKEKMMIGGMNEYSWLKKGNKLGARTFTNTYKEEHYIVNGKLEIYQETYDYRSLDFHTLDKHFWPVFYENCPEVKTHIDPTGNYRVKGCPGLIRSHLRVSWDMVPVPCKNLVQLKKATGLYILFTENSDSGYRKNDSWGIYKDFSKKYQPIPPKILKR